MLGIHRGLLAPAWRPPLKCGGRSGSDCRKQVLGLLLVALAHLVLAVTALILALKV